MKLVWSIVSALRKLDKMDHKLDHIISMIESLQKEGMIMASDLSVIQAQVEKTIGVEQSAITLIQGLAAQIADLKNDPAALQALADQLSASADALSSAVAANPGT